MNFQYQQQSTTNFFNQSKTLFTFKNVSVSFGDIFALKQVSFEIERKEILFLTGASGAGKTTLIRLLSQDLFPSSGEIVNHLDLGKDKLTPIFQDIRIIEDFTIEENLWLIFCKKIHKNKNQFHKELLELAQVFGIKDRLHHKAGSVNGGLKQKVAILRSLMCHPQVLLADEPTSSLDSDNASKLFDVLNFYNSKRDLTLIWASHNRELVKKFPGKSIHLDKGRLVYKGHACFI